MKVKATQLVVRLDIPGLEKRARLPGSLRAARPERTFQSTPMLLLARPVKKPGAHHIGSEQWISSSPLMEDLLALDLEGHETSASQDHVLWPVLRSAPDVRLFT